MNYFPCLKEESFKIDYNFIRIHGKIGKPPLELEIRKNIINKNEKYKRSDMVLLNVTKPSVLISTELYTLPLEMNFFLWGGEIVDPIGLSAVAVFTGIIPVILYMILQKYIVIGLVRGALKR
jgi:hypothetical protein